MSVGRKPIDYNLLRGYAAQWAGLLYAIRDGQPGLALPIDKSKDSALRVRSKGRTLRRTRVAGERKHIIPLTAKPFDIQKEDVLTFPAGSPLAYHIRAMASNSRNEFRYELVPPVQPNREIWDRFTAAKSAKDVEKAFKEIRKWVLEIQHVPYIPNVIKTTQVLGYANSEARARSDARTALQEGKVSPWPWLPFLFSSDWSGKTLAAKRLWTYPRSNRKKSDDKRIEFFARALAAITIGKSPATTARWLAGWQLHKDWYTRPIDPEGETGVS